MSIYYGFTSRNNSCISMAICEKLQVKSFFKKYILLAESKIFNLGPMCLYLSAELKRNIWESFKLTASMWTLTQIRQDVFELGDWHTNVMSWRLLITG